MEMEENITVRRSVHEAACKLEKAAEKWDGDFTDWDMAGWLCDTFRDIGLDEEADFWRDVYQYLMCLLCMSFDVTICIVEDNRAG